MPFGLYDATIPTYLQFLGTMRTLVEKAETFCVEREMAEADLLDVHFGPDMLPLSWQIRWTCTHSIGALEGVRAGVFHPDDTVPTENLEAFRERIGRTITELKQVTPEEMNGYVGKEMVFLNKKSGLKMDFLAQDFLLSFSVPNFFFHVTMAYGLLRHQGLEIGKRNYFDTIRTRAVSGLSK